MRITTIGADFPVGIFPNEHKDRKKGPPVCTVPTVLDSVY